MKQTPKHHAILVACLALAILQGACTGSGGNGDGGTVTPTPTPSTKATRFVYVANAADNSVSTYAVDAATGRLKYMEKVASGASPNAVAVDPSGRYAYVANSFNGPGGNSVSQYTIAADGRLTAMGAASVPAGQNPHTVTVHPTGKYAYVSNWFSASISQFTIGASGALSAMTTASAPTGVNPNVVVIDPSGKFAYVANKASGSISQYTIGADGALNAMSPASAPAGLGPNSVTIHPSGQYAYATNVDGANVSQFAIGADGKLSAMTTPNVAAGVWPRSITLEPSGKYAYVANGFNGAGGNTVSQYTIGADGSLSPMVTATIAAGAGPGSIGADAAGKYVYVSNSGNDSISQYTIAPNGSLAPNAPMTAVAHAAPAGMAMSNGASPLVALARFAYVANGDGSVSAYTVNAGTGALAPVMGSPYVAGVLPGAVASEPGGRYVYVTNQMSDSVSAYRVNAATGALTPIDADPGAMGIQNAAAGVSPFAIAIDPRGKFAYVANFGGGVSAYLIDPGSGVLAPIDADPGVAGIQNFVAGLNPSAIVVEPSGNFVYVTNSTSGSISAYAINAVTGALSGIGTTVVAGQNPVYITADPSGRFLYATNHDTAGISAYAINAGTGALTPINCTAVCTSGFDFSTVVGPDAFIIDPSGRFAFVLSSLSGNVSAYTLDATTGVPANLGAVAAVSNPIAATIDPSGKFFYVLDLSLHHIAAYGINASSATFTSLGSPTPTGTNPQSMTVIGAFQ